MMMRQIDAIHRDGNEVTRTVAWVENDKRLKIGTKFTFKNDDRKWEVQFVSENMMDSKSLHTDWAVGGLV